LLPNGPFDREFDRKRHEMTSIYQRKDKRWVAQYTDVTGKQKYLYAAKRKDVKAKLDKALEDQKQGLKQNADKLTLSEYLEDWLSATTGTVAESSHDRRLYLRPLTLVTTYSRRSGAFTLLNERDTVPLRYRCDNKWACSEPHLITPLQRSSEQALLRGIEAYGTSRR
jgi:hypothetical protein